MSAPNKDELIKDLAYIGMSSPLESGHQLTCSLAPRSLLLPEPEHLIGRHDEARRSYRSGIGTTFRLAHVYSPRLGKHPRDRYQDFPHLSLETEVGLFIS